MSDIRPTRHWSRHWGGFIVSGAAAGAVDALVTLTLIRFAGRDPFSARLFAILLAMVVAWLLHRRITFAVSAPPSLKEFMRFAAIAWSANALNFAIYVAVLVAWPRTLPLAALVLGTGVAAVFSYLGFRLGVFREPPPLA